MKNNKTLGCLINSMKINNVNKQKKWLVFSMGEHTFLGKNPILKCKMLDEEHRIYDSLIVWEEVEIHKSMKTVRDSFGLDIVELEGYFIVCLDR